MSAAAPSAKRPKPTVPAGLNPERPTEAGTAAAGKGGGARPGHARAIALMVGAALLWSTAGVVTRHLSPALQADGRFEITFWRALFAGIFIVGYLWFARGKSPRVLVDSGRAGWLSGLAWAVMFTAFMLALTLTTVSNTLITMSISPLLTALLARAFLKTAIAPRTWVAIAVAGAGMVWMFAHGLTGGRNELLGMLVALMVPVASAINLVTLERSHARVDLVPAVGLGGLISAALSLVVVLISVGPRFLATPSDVLLLALLGFFQLGVPCTMMVAAARRLTAPEISLLALLEVVLGPIWAWAGAGEVPAGATLAGGCVVVVALMANEVAALRAGAQRA